MGLPLSGSEPAADEGLPVGAINPRRLRRLAAAGARSEDVSFRAVERLILALRTDFGCLVIIVAFLVIMISTIVFADIITPPSSNPFV